MDLRRLKGERERYLEGLGNEKRGREEGFARIERGRKARRNA